MPHIQDLYSGHPVGGPKPCFGPSAAIPSTKIWTLSNYGVSRQSALFHVRHRTKDGVWKPGVALETNNTTITVITKDRHHSSIRSGVLVSIR